MPGELGLGGVAVELAVPGDAASGETGKGGFDFGTVGTVADDAQRPVFAPAAVEDAGEGEVALQLGTLSHHRNGDEAWRAR